MQQDLQIEADEVEAFVIDGKNTFSSSLSFPLAVVSFSAVVLEAVVVFHAFPPFSLPFSSCSYQDGVLQNRPDAEKGRREVRLHLCDR